MMSAAGCSKDKTTVTRTWLQNTTAHTIAIEPYFRGVLVPGQSLTLTAGQLLEVARGTSAGFADRTDFAAGFLHACDSIVVTFNNQHKISHYRAVPAQARPRHYPFAAARNLLNKENYPYTRQDVNAYGRNTSYLFTFTEQDYRDAQ